MELLIHSNFTCQGSVSIIIEEVKKYQPKYNIMLKDDKTYPFICIKNEPFPRVFLTRNVKA